LLPSVQLTVVSSSEFVKLFRAPYEFVPPGLVHVQTPTLVVYGDHEVPPVKVQGQQFVRTVAAGTLREVAGAGHLVNQDQPRVFNDTCGTALERVTPPQVA